MSVPPFSVDRINGLLERLCSGAPCTGCAGAAFECRFTLERSSHQLKRAGFLPAHRTDSAICPAVDDSYPEDREPPKKIPSPPTGEEGTGASINKAVSKGFGLFSRAPIYAAFCILTAHTLNSGIFEMGSRALLVNLFTAAS